jgi:hypothetical protein
MRKDHHGDDIAIDERYGYRLEVHVVPNLKISEGRWLNNTRKKNEVLARL